mmetsp:Transcript_9302/g.33894  ORF Transcript_9302/g.33894 Transcript_9302/m.33894 type:complete len:209 (-) Transcript_9302:2670-3296(-)
MSAASSAVRSAGSVSTLGSGRYVGMKCRSNASAPCSSLNATSVCTIPSTPSATTWSAGGGGGLGSVFSCSRLCRAVSSGKVIALFSVLACRTDIRSLLAYETHTSLLPCFSSFVGIDGAGAPCSATATGRVLASSAKRASYSSSSLDGVVGVSSHRTAPSNTRGSVPAVKITLIMTLSPRLRTPSAGSIASAPIVSFPASAQRFHLKS